MLDPSLVLIYPSIATSTTFGCFGVKAAHLFQIILFSDKLISCCLSFPFSALLLCDCLFRAYISRHLHLTSSDQERRAQAKTQMDAISPHSADLSPIASTASGASKQPTYTTVGSIYNPDATTPIQKPARRPRPRRYPNINSQSPPADSPLSFQNSLLALPGNDTTPTSPTPGANRLVQYHKLQQNLDRAVSPGIADEPLQHSFGMPVPTIRSGNLPPTNLGLALTRDQKHTTVGIREPEDREEILDLSCFTTKGLTSLASYPNPMQMAAKNTLAKARAGNLGIGRADTPTSFSYMSSDSGKGRADSVFGGPPTAKTTGAPQPLTAGPPGHRQFQASTFKGTIKAFQRPQEDQSSTRPHSPATSDLLAMANAHHDPHGTYVTPPNIWGHEPDLNYSGYPALNGLALRNQTGSSSPAIRNLNASSMAFRSHYGHDDKSGNKVHDTLSYQSAKQYYPHGFPSNYEKRNVDVLEDWDEKYPLPEYGYPAEAEDVDEAAARIDRKFYSGTERYIKDMDQIQRDYDHRRFTKTIGVIGGERQRFQKQQENTAHQTDGKVQLRPLSIEEANGMEDSMHAAPLVNMAFNTIMQWKEASESRASPDKGWGPKFAQADPSLIDNSKGANNSFFTEEKVEVPKKKKLFKKMRRGY